MDLAGGQVERHMQPHRVIEPDLAPPECPGHPRQHPPHRAVDDAPPPGAAAGQLGRVGLGRQPLEDRLEQLRGHHRLRRAETAQADGAAAHFALHPRQRAGLAQAAHRLDHRIEQPEQRQAQVLPELELPIEFGPGAGGAAAFLHFLGQHRLKALDQAPPLQITRPEGRRLGTRGDCNLICIRCLVTIR